MTVALLVLALAIPTAAVVLWPLRHRSAAPPAEAEADPVAALDAEKTLALRALRELEFDHTTGLLAEADYEGLRARYEARAAAILEHLDRLPRRPAPAATPPPPARRAPWTHQRPVVLAGAGAALLLFGVALGMLVVRQSAPAAPEADRAPAAAADEPGEAPRPISKAMLEGMLKAAHASLDAGRYQEAIAAYKAVLKREPRNVDAITHLGVILALAGHGEAAIEAFDRALAIDPSYAHALWDKARVLHDDRQDYAGAIAAWERFVQVAPPGPDREQALARIREARARTSAAPAPAAPVSGGKAAP